jgi:glycosyltransferase involved in cell wall biosynthesis
LEALHRTDLEFADHIVFVSKHLLQDACKLYGRNLANKSSVIPAPVREQAFLQDSKRARASKLTFAYVGRLYWFKGVLFLINAFSRLAKTNRDVALRLYGTGPLERTIRKRIKRLELGHLVELRGWVEHSKLLSELSTDVDVVVHPSLYEACPIAVLEAMSMGKPIIVSDLPWSEEFVKDQVTGLRSRLDESSLCNQMEILLRNEALCLHLGKNARLFAESNFHPTKIAEAYVRLFGELSDLPA